MKNFFKIPFILSATISVFYLLALQFHWLEFVALKNIGLIIIGSFIFSIGVFFDQLFTKKTLVINTIYSIAFYLVWIFSCFQLLAFEYTFVVYAVAITLQFLYLLQLMVRVSAKQQIIFWSLSALILFGMIALFIFPSIHTIAATVLTISLLLISVLSIVSLFFHPIKKVQ